MRPRNRLLVCVLLSLSVAGTGLTAVGGEPSAVRPFGISVSAYEYPKHDLLWKLRLEDYQKMMDHAVASGVNNVKLLIRWADVEPESGVFDFQWHDRLMDDTLTRYPDLTLAITPVLAPPAWFPDELKQRGADGQVFPIPGESCLVDFHQEEGRRLTSRFFVEATKHYEARFPGRILFTSIGLNPWFETEYWHGQYADYSDAAEAAFRAWVAEHFLSVDRVNARWGTSYKSLGEVRQPRVKLDWKRTTPDESLQLLDWYRFRHIELKSVIDRMAGDLHEAIPGIKVCAQFGCVWDRLSASRGSYGVADLVENVDVVMIDDAWHFDSAMSAEILKASCPGKETGNEIPPPDNEWFQDPAKAGAEALRMGADGYRHGLDYLEFCHWQWRGSDYIRQADFIEQLAVEAAVPYETPEYDEEMVLSVTELYRMHESKSMHDKIQADYGTLSEGGTKRVRVVLKFDLFDDGWNEE